MQAAKAVGRVLEDSPLALSWAAEDEERDILQSVSRIGRALPLVGNFIPAYYKNLPKADSTTTVHYSRGINGQSDMRENSRSTEDVRNFLKKDVGYRTVGDLPYRGGSGTDVFFSLLNLNNSSEYRALNQLLKSGVRKGDVIDLVGHSGGVERVLGLSDLAGDRGIGVRNIVGVAGPSWGRYTNAVNTAFIGSSEDDNVSRLQQTINPLLFTSNKVTNFTPNKTLVPGIDLHHRNLEHPEWEQPYYEFIKRYLRR